MGIAGFRGFLFDPCRFQEVLLGSRGGVRRGPASVGFGGRGEDISTETAFRMLGFVSKLDIVLGLSGMVRL